MSRHASRCGGFLFCSTLTTLLKSPACSFSITLARFIVRESRHHVSQIRASKKSSLRSRQRKQFQITPVFSGQHRVVLRALWNLPRSRFTVEPFSDLILRSHFPRNEPPNPAKYSRERPEMSFSRREIKEGQNKKEK